MEIQRNESTTQDRARIVRERYIALRAQFIAYHAAARDAARFSLGREHVEQQDAAERFAAGVRNYSATIAELTREFALAPVDIADAAPTSDTLDRLFDRERPGR